jgi:hypothetical protein
MAARTVMGRRAEARATGPETHKNKEGCDAHHLAKLRAKRRCRRSGGEGDRRQRPEVEDGGGELRFGDGGAVQDRRRLG